MIRKPLVINDGQVQQLPAGDAMIPATPRILSENLTIRSGFNALAVRSIGIADGALLRVESGAGFYVVD